MGAWGVIVSVWAAVLVGVRWPEVIHDLPLTAMGLPPSAKDLPPPAITCHLLPRCVSFSTAVGRSLFRRKKRSVEKSSLKISGWFQVMASQFVGVGWTEIGLA